MCRGLELPYSTLRRWRGRHRRGEPPVRRPGPHKIAPLPVAELRSRVAGLDHADRRTRGTTALHLELRDAVSRRDLAALVREQRREARRRRRDELQHVTWHHPNLAWAIDAATIRCSPRDPGLVLVLARDLASHFHLDPLVLPAESAAANTRWLSQLLQRHPPPLLLKRDNGSPFNEELLDTFLSEQWILPLNSPVRTPRYNGAIEHGIGSLKRDLAATLDPEARVAQSQTRLLALARALIALRNARPRRSLGGLSPAQAYHQAPPLAFTRHQRIETFEWISDHAVGTLETQRDTAGPHDLSSAWRGAVVAWLRRRHLITVSQNDKPLPLFVHQIRS